MTRSAPVWRWVVDDRIELVEGLFGAWSSGDPDAPRPFLTEEAVLDDVIGGVHRGWPAIRAYFARGLASWPDLRLEPTGEWWSRDDGPLRPRHRGTSLAGARHELRRLRGEPGPPRGRLPRRRLPRTFAADPRLLRP
jgi:SnoaL-like domain